MSDNLDYFKLLRDFWDFCFENPEKIKPNHPAMYCFIVEHCNRLGWKSKFGLPTTMVKDAIGIRSYNTYIETLNDLVSFGFIKIIEKSKNQYSANIVAILNFDKAQYKALDKALIKHSIKQVKSTVQSIDSIDKQYTNIPITINNIHTSFAHLKISFDEFNNLLDLGYSEIEIKNIFEKIENYKKNTNYKSLFLTAKNWLKLEKEKSCAKKESEPIVAGRQTMATIIQNSDMTGIINPHAVNNG
jgi:hypothetical protein